MVMMERELLLLGLIQEQEMHGYRLNEFISGAMQSCVDLKKSTAYYLLDKLTRQGYVTHTEEQSGNRPVRRVYRITAAGQQRFDALLRDSLRTFQPQRFPGDTGLIFLEKLPTAEAIALLQKRRSALMEALAQARLAPPHSGGQQWVIEHQVVTMEAELSWLDSLINRLNTT